MDSLKRIKTIRPHGTIKKGLDELGASDTFTELRKLVKKLKAKGAILILQTDDGNKITQTGLTPKQIRENLCLAIYYSEAVNLDIAGKK